MRKNAREVSCYLSAEEAARFREAAASSKVSLSRYLRQCLLDYVRITAGDLTKPNSFALAETEERLSRRIEAQNRCVATVQGHLHLVLAMLDRLAFISLVHLPEVPPDRRETVLATLPCDVRSIATRSRWPLCSSREAPIEIQEEARA